MHPSEQKCAHFCSEWCIVEYRTCAFWDMWDWCIVSVNGINRPNTMTYSDAVMDKFESFKMRRHGRYVYVSRISNWISHSLILPSVSISWIYVLPWFRLVDDEVMDPQVDPVSVVGTEDLGELILLLPIPFNVAEIHVNLSGPPLPELNWD